jgi:hypothetical protein
MSSTTSSERLLPPKTYVPVHHPKLRKGHWMVAKMSFFNVLTLAIALTGILPLFWGSMYKRSDRAHNLKMAVINWDNDVVGNAFVDLVNERPNLPHLVTIKPVVSSEYTSLEQIEELVVQYKFWGAFVVFENSTATLRAALESGNQDDYWFKTLHYFNTGGRQESAHATYCQPQVDALEFLFQEQKVPEIIRNLTADFSNDKIKDLLTNTPRLLTSPLEFQNNDIRPFSGGVASAIDNVGLIYLVIISFYQVMMWGFIHNIQGEHMILWQFFIYRTVINLISIFFISLFFSLVSLAFGQDFTLRYGRGGFVVYWMINFLSMAALGGATDNIMAFFAKKFPATLAIWLLFWVIFNSAPGMFPLEMSPGVYQFGHALPVFNAVEAIRTILFNVHSEIGLNVGVLIGWIALNSVVNYISLVYTRYFYVEEREKAARKELEKSQVVEEVREA